MPEKVIGTSALDILETLYISTSPKFLYRLYFLVTIEYSKFLLLKFYFNIIIFVSGLYDISI